MIHFIIATNSEARPLIDLFKLKKKNSDKLQIYSNRDISLTITGIGKINSAIGVIQTFYETTQKINDCWINFGLAGHKSHAVGKIFTIKKIHDQETGQNIYPFVNNFQIDSDECISLGKEKKKYNSKIYEMESSGFFNACNKFSSKEFIQVLKIISDNHFESIDFKNNEQIYNLIIQHKEIIIEFTEHMKKIETLIYDKNQKSIDEEFLKLFKKENFTFTEEKQMKSLLKLYFTKYNSIKKNIFNVKENGDYNIKRIRNFLRL